MHKIARILPRSTRPKSSLELAYVQQKSALNASSEKRNGNDPLSVLEKAQMKQSLF